MHCAVGGVSAPGGVVCSQWMSAPGDVPTGGLYLPGGVPAGGVPGYIVLTHCMLGYTPPVNRMTDKCKNITFANFVCGR